MMGIHRDPCSQCVLVGDAVVDADEPLHAVVVVVAVAVAQPALVALRVEDVGVAALVVVVVAAAVAVGDARPVVRLCNRWGIERSSTCGGITGPAHTGRTQPLLALDPDLLDGRL